MPTTTLGSHTAKDWLSTPEGEHWQLTHGRLILTEETYANSSLAREIEVEMALYLREHPSGVVDRQIAFSFPGMPPSDREGVVPDLYYLPKGELSKIDPRANAQEGVIPALVAEMLSPSTRKIDLVDKVEIYREAGVAEYWIFDLEEENVRIYPLPGKTGGARRHPQPRGNPDHSPPAGIFPESAEDPPIDPPKTA